jgi:[acyl-carrier-protein] S-malonyltransferase
LTALDGATDTVTLQISLDEPRRRADVVPVTVAEPLDVSTAIAVGSITAALAGSGAVRRVAAAVTADVRIPAEQLAYAADVLGEEPSALTGEA